jgi:hypothetical protein
VATAIPLQSGDVDANMGNFLKLVEDAAGESELGQAVRSLEGQ